MNTVEAAEATLASPAAGVEEDFEVLLEQLNQTLEMIQSIRRQAA